MIENYIYIMKMFAEGVTIQRMSKVILSDVWHDDLNPVWNFETNYYRVKPIPRKFWLRLDDSIIAFAEPTSLDNWIPVQEIIDEG